MKNRKTVTIYPDMLAEGIHVAFRKASDHPKTSTIWNAIAQLPPDEWAAIVDFVLKGSSVPERALKKTGVGAILVERKRQIDEEGWTPEHDDKYQSGEMAGAAACYILHGMMPELPNRLRHDAGDVVKRLWPFHVSWFKTTNLRRDLVKAGALIAAQIDRLDRKEAQVDDK